MLGLAAYSRGKVRIGAIAILGAVAFAFLAFTLMTTPRVGQAQLPQPVAQRERPTDLSRFPSLSRLPRKLTESKPFQRSWWAFVQRAYPLGYIPIGAKLRALQQIEKAKAERGLASPQVAGNAWVNIGPAPVQVENGGSSGRVPAIAVDPGNPSHWLIGAAQGGVWETLDAGTTWAARTDAQASLTMGAITFSPSNPSIVYAGTGEPNFGLDVYAGAGLLKSNDGGATWTLMAAATFAGTSFSAIRVNPADPNVVLAATVRAIGSANLSNPPPNTPPRGIFKSTDGGVTWSQKLNDSIGVTALEAEPGNFNNQYAAIGGDSGEPSNGVYRSTDSGETWTLINGPWNSLADPIGRIALAISPSSPATLYVSIQDAGANYGTLLGVWRTDNAWDAAPTWTQLPTPSGAGDQLWYDHVITVDPANSNILYLGATPLFRFDGTSWNDITNGIHVDQHAMAWVGTQLIVGNDGGVWSTTNGGAAWSNHNTTLSITQFYAGSVHPTNANFALGASQDNGTETWTGAIGWPQIFGDDGGANAISSSLPDTDWQVLGNVTIFRTTDGGATFVAADTGITEGQGPSVFTVHDIAKCPSNDDVFIAGGEGFFRSDNFFSASTPTWSDNLR